VVTGERYDGNRVYWAAAAKKIGKKTLERYGQKRIKILKIYKGG